MENVTQIVVKPGDLHAGVKTHETDFYRIDVVVDAIAGPAGPAGALAGGALATVMLTENGRVAIVATRHHLPPTWKMLWTS